MFKNFLTYSFAVYFHQSCLEVATLPKEERESLLKSAKKTIESLAASAKATTGAQEIRHIAAALLCLRDCGEILDLRRAWNEELRARYGILSGRLESLVGKPSRLENTV